MPIATWGVVAILCVFWAGLGSLIVNHSREHDFVSFYVGSTLALEGNFSGLYDRDVQFSRQREVAPAKSQLVPYVRPPFYLALLAPLSLFSLHAAFWLWIAGHALLLVACWLWASRRFGPDAMIFGALYLPTALGIAHGQDCVLMLAIGIGFYQLADQRKDFSAGAVLALGLLKFHLLLLLPLAMILKKRWRMLAGYTVTGGLLALTSIAVIGLGGVKQYVSLLQAKDLSALLPSPELMINLNGLMANVGLESVFVLALLVVMVIVVVIIGVRGAPLWRWLSISVAGSLLITHHVYGYDAGIVLLPVWLLDAAMGIGDVLQYGLRDHAVKRFVLKGDIVSVGNQCCSVTHVDVGFDKVNRRQRKDGFQAGSDGRSSDDEYVGIARNVLQQFGEPGVVLLGPDVSADRR